MSEQAYVYVDRCDVQAYVTYSVLGCRAHYVVTIRSGLRVCQREHEPTTPSCIPAVYMQNVGDPVWDLMSNDSGFALSL